MSHQHRTEAAEEHLSNLYFQLVQNEEYLHRLDQEDSTALPTDWKKKSKDERTKWKREKAKAIMKTSSALAKSIRSFKSYIKVINKK